MAEVELDKFFCPCQDCAGETAAGIMMRQMDGVICAARANALDCLCWTWNRKLMRTCSKDVCGSDYGQDCPYSTNGLCSKKKAGEGNRVGGGSSQEQCINNSVSYTMLTKPCSETDGRTGIERIPPRSNPGPYGGGTVGGDKTAVVEVSAHAVPHARAPAQPSICPTCSRPLPEKDGEVLCGGR